VKEPDSEFDRKRGRAASALTVSLCRTGVAATSFAWVSCPVFAEKGIGSLDVDAESRPLAWRTGSSEMTHE